MMKEYDIRKLVKFGEKEFCFKEYFNDDFSELKNVTQVLGVVLNDENEILMVSEDGKSWSLPGGTIEEGETYVQTLKREVYEESAVEIDENILVPFFYLEAFRVRDGAQEFETSQIRYVSKVKKVDKFEKDPGGNHQYREFFKIDDIEKYLHWAGTSAFMKKYLIKYIESGKLYN